MLEINEIINRLKEIKKQGYIKSNRKGSTGVGKTLEDLLGITENNLSLPDFGEVELKSMRSGDNSMLTLFTFNKKAWKMDQLEAIEKFGSFDSNGRKGLYYTLSTVPNSHGLFTYVDKDSVQVRSIDGEVIVKWLLDDLVEQFENKVKNILLVNAQVEERDEIEYFYYDRARLLSGGTENSILSNQFKEGQIVIDLRLHKKVNSNSKPVSRNHGTGFRVRQSNLVNMYENISEINLD
ncbi:hypothetical protein HC766_00015 [Candidatus Gracilibacteria bacterium]|nr:hypothetical protein [Candidatus Gracilibacteria bacterium]NJS40780.1 hypothetical protein [Candidatus Gracilibacteria bacterium]